MWQDVKTLNGAANSLIALVLLACVASAVWWVSQRDMFTLRTIRIEGIGQSDLQHVNPLTVRQSALGRISGNFFSTNLETVRLAFESVPWVNRATVRREWPDQLIVTVEEHEALGTWGEDGRLLSTKGEVFTANVAEADEDHALPQFSGPEGSEKEVLARFTQLRGWFAAIGLVPEALALSSRYAWTVRLDNGMRVALGREQSTNTLKERMDRLTGIYPQLAARLQDKIDTIDMRYPNGLALSSAALKIPVEGKPPVRPAARQKSSKPVGKHIQ